MRNQMLLCVAAFTAICAASAHGTPFVTPSVPFTLSSVTATHQQGGFEVAKSIDGIVTGTAGWAIAGGTGANQFAVYQASGISVGELGSELTITHVQARGDTHLLGNFRYWVTTDPSPTTVSGATWTQLVPDSISTASGAVYLIQPDNRMVWDVSQGLPAGAELNDIYTIITTIPSSITAAGITGFRLETVADGSLSSLTNVTGPGLTVNNGNFVLTEVQMSAAAIIAVPEPSSFLLLGIGALGLVQQARRRRQKA